MEQQLYLPPKTAPAKPDGIDLAPLKDVAPALEKLATAVKVAPKEFAAELAPAAFTFWFGVCVGLALGLVIAALVGQRRG